jgi:hypothetical protein
VIGSFQKNSRGIFLFFYFNKPMGKNMKKTFLASSMAILTMTAINAMGAGCPSGYTEASVSGSVSTMNISATQQFGSIDMQLTKNGNSKVLFDESGDLLGTITDRSDDGLVTTLSHTITFDDGSTIETMGDKATVQYSTSDCSFVVEEIISNFWGTQTFKRATGEIRADGSISFPPYCENQNTFELSGTVCLWKGRK